MFEQFPQRGHSQIILSIFDPQSPNYCYGLADIYYFLEITRKYPLRGYILGVLMHTTAWDRLWGGDVFLRLYIRSSASPRLTAV